MGQRSKGLLNQAIRRLRLPGDMGCNPKADRYGSKRPVDPKRVFGKLGAEPRADRQGGILCGLRHQYHEKVIIVAA